MIIKSECSLDQECLLRFLTYEQHKSPGSCWFSSMQPGDVFAKLGKLYRRRVMGGCLQGGGAYKLLREQENEE